MKNTNETTEPPPLAPEGLTEAQARAVEARGLKLLVSAGPGSGKTRVLVSRFQSFIERDRVSPERLLAVTFTEKAANEMKRRIVEQLRAKGRGAERRALEGAWVLTVHGFAARLLKEHPVEAGVDPNFAILSEEEAETLQDSLAREMVEACAEEDPAFFELLLAVGEETLRESLLKVVDKCRSLALSPADAFERAKPPPLAPLFEAFDSALAAVVQAGRGSTAAARERAEASEEARKRLAALRRKKPGWEGLEALRGMKGVLAATGTKGSLKGLLYEAQAARGALCSAFLEHANAPLYRAAAGAARRLDERYAQAKREQGLLDFNDLEARALALLAGEGPEKRAVQARLAAYFQALFVDEFQDTNAVQERLLEPLAGREPMRVGDRNQSVYHFRGAEPHVFRAAEEAHGKDPAGELLTMAENFRARPDLVAFTNNLFAALGLEGLRSETLLARRAAAGARPCVEMHWAIAGAHEEIKRARVREAAHLAGALRDLIEEENVQVGGEDGRLRAARYGDVAILFRAMSNVGIFEYELRAAGIPYLVLGGHGFYERPEVKDMICLLKCLENPFHDIPLAAVLRSPLVGASDDTLLALARFAKSKDERKPLWSAFQKLRFVKGLAAGERARLEDFLKLHAHYARELERLRISELLLRLLGETRYELKVLREADGERRAANLRKLVEIARRFEAQELLRLGDFIRYVEGLRDREVRESEGLVEGESEAEGVTLMSIHRAKGLEFPIVVLADLGSKPQGGRPELFRVSRERGVGMKARPPEAAALEKTATYSAIESEEQAEEAGENARLLYVAVTRARDLLLLSGVRKEKAKKADEEDEEEAHGGGAGGKKDTWCRMIAEAAGLAHEPCDEVRAIFGVNVRVVQEAPAERSGHPTRLARLIDRDEIAAALKRAEPLDLKGAGAEEAQAAVRALFASFAQQRKFYPETRELSTTAASTLLTCPRRYAYLYEESIPEAGWREPEDAEPARDPEAPEPLPANDFGTLVHRMLERLDFSGDLRPALEDASAILRPFLAEPDRRALLSKLMRFFESPLGQAIRRARSRAAELPFSLKVGGGVIRGQIDLLFQREDGVWEVVDYKSTEGSAAELAAASDRYRFQILTYALAAEALLGARPAAASLAYVLVPEAKRYELSDSVLESARRESERVFSTLRRPAFDPVKGPTCDYCSFKPFCPAWSAAGT